MFRSLLALLILVTLSPAPHVLAAPPNIVVILTDDQGWGDLSSNGNQNLRTPRIDSLGADGATLDRFFVCPVCSPTRAEFLTGRYHPRGGVRGVSEGGERLDADERTLADVFKAAGYATGAFGKWHNGTQWPLHPNARGFDEYYGFTSGHWGSYFDPLLDHNGELTTGKGYVVDDLTTHAIEFIQSHQDKPFFCYLPLNVPHSPMAMPDAYWDRFENHPLPQRAGAEDQEDLDHTRAALAMCENIDWNVGRVLDALNSLKLAENTIVVYFSDNGPNGYRWNGDMKGRKGSTDEGGVRSPFLIRWPGHIPAGRTIPQIAAAIDLLPTLTDLANVQLPSDRELDGRSLKPLLLEQNPTAWPDRQLFSMWNRKISVRTQQYRLDHTGELFDMLADPGQKTPVTADHPKITRELRDAVSAWKDEMLALVGDDDRPLSVGYPEFPLTQLPARDGRPHGNVERSGKAPNCSFFTHWTQPDDQITWDIDVHTNGRYLVELLYACPAADLGSQVEVRFNDRRLPFTVTEPHDPPLYGIEQDRVHRGSESYVKDFKRLTVGEMDLPAGRGPLTLQATTVPGSQVMEVRMLLLTLLP